MSPQGGNQAAVWALVLVTLSSGSSAFSTLRHQQQKQRHPTRLHIGSSYLDSLSSQTHTTSNHVNGNSYSHSVNGNANGAGKTGEFLVGVLGDLVSAIIERMEFL